MSFTIYLILFHRFFKTKNFVSFNQENVLIKYSKIYSNKKLVTLIPKELKLLLGYDKMTLTASLIFYELDFKKTFLFGSLLFDNKCIPKFLISRVLFAY